MKVYEEPLSQKPEALQEIKGPYDEDLVSKNKEQDSIHAKATLFVSTIPFNATNEDLEFFFSQVGPIRSCFLVKKEGKSTGCGFVQFALPEDAKKALTELKKKKFQDKRTLKLAFAVRKGVADERKKAGIPLDAGKKEEERKAKELAQVQKKIKVVPEGPGTLPSKSISKKIENSVTIEISGLPPGLTKQILNKKVRKFGTVKEIDLNDGADTGKIVYSSSKEAKCALKHLDKHTYKGVKIGCAIVETITAASIAKRGRLIVRNLAFSCKKEHLLHVFDAFGEIVDCSVPTNSGKARGFGFVQFQSVEDAARAIEQMNGHKILKRPVAIDWALGKSQYEILSAAENESASTRPDESDDQIEDCKNENELVESSEDDEAIIFSDADDEQEHHQAIISEPEPNSTLFVRNLSFDTTKDAMKTLFRKWGELNYAVITMDKVTGISRGNGFICFISADSASKCLNDYQEALHIFESMGFAQSAPQTATGDYQVKSSLNPSLPETAQESTKDFMLDGRLISVTLAVSKQIAEKISQASALSRRASDKRHLYLMREGVIVPGSEASKELTSQELEHCASQFANKKRLLATNPNLFISRTRLSIRGLPPKLSDHELRLKAKQAVKTFWEQIANGKRDALEPEVVDEELTQGLDAPGLSRKVILKQAKIIKDVERLDPITKKPKSKGYGFIEFSSHADALACLRVLNNQRNAFLSEKVLNQDGSQTVTKSKRLVLEFAVENQLVLKKRMQRNITDPKPKLKDTVLKENRKRKANAVENISAKDGPSTKKVKTKESKFKERRLKRQAKVLENIAGTSTKNPAIISITTNLAVKKSSNSATVQKKRKNIDAPFSAIQKSKKLRESSDAFDQLLSQYSAKRGFQAL